MDQDAGFYQMLIHEMSDGVYFVDRSRTITFWSKGAQRITGYPADDVVGRKCRAGILNHVDDKGRPLCGARCPLKATIIDGQQRDAHVWLHHADGHRHPVWVRAAPIRSADGTVVGAVEMFSDDTATSMARTKMAELERLAMADPLTGLGNRRYLEGELDASFDEFLRQGQLFGILLADIDHFKNVNDQFGHDVGDDCLKMVARTLSYSLRRGEAVARFGGEEFVVVLRRTQPAALQATAELLRNLVASSRQVVNRRPVRLTISIGATMVMPGDDAPMLLRRADSLLYEAKIAGRNRVATDIAPTEQNGAARPRQLRRASD